MVLVIVTLFVFVSIAYVIGLTWWLERSYIIAAIALILGNWILVNVVYHYYKALTIPPGNPPEVSMNSYDQVFYRPFYSPECFDLRNRVYM